MSKRTRATTRRRFVLAIVGVCAISVPSLQGQEAEPARDSAWAVDRPLSVLLGVRGELTGILSPGASLQLTWNTPDRWPWLAVEFLAQTVRWNVQYDDKTRRDQLHFGRLRLGVGKGQGPSVFVFFEKGRGTIKTEPAYWRAKIYDLEGLGAGMGITVGRISSSVEASIGGANRSSPDLYGSLGVALQFRAF